MRKDQGGRNNYYEDFSIIHNTIKKWFNITLCHSVNKHILELLKRLEFSPNSFIFLVSQDYFKHICGLV